MNMLEMLAAAAAAEDEDEAPGPRPLHEAQVATLLELHARYAAALHDPPFAPGTLVTPRAGTGLSGAEEPHVVLEVRYAAPDFDVAAPPGSSGFGCRFDLRVGALSQERQPVLRAYWVESWAFELYPSATDPRP